MKTYTLEQVTDKLIDQVGDKNRDKFERELQAELRDYIEKIKKIVCAL